VRGPDAVSSATWTGRPSLREHAAVIQALAPVALEAVQRLIDDEEHARDNGGPVDADRAVAPQQLKALHHALRDLIAAVGQGRSLAPVFERLRVVRQEAKVAIGRATRIAGDDVGADRVRQRRWHRKILRRQCCSSGCGRWDRRQYDQGRYAQEGGRSQLRA